jgi:AraC-like DNA-binding protein
MANMAQFIFGWTSDIARGPGGRHNHHAIELVFHQQGRGCVHTDDFGSIPFVDGDIQITPTGQYHRQQQDTDGIDCCILFSADRNITRRINFACAYPISQSPYPASELITLSTLPKPQNAQEQQIADHRLTAVLLEILRIGERFEPQAQPTTRRQEMADTAHSYLRTHWRKIQQIKQIADALDISMDYLRHVYREHYDVTIYQALTEMRIEHACDLLMNSQLPLKALPAVCGFADVQQFSRRFKQITGMAPGQYRQQSR